MGKRILTCFFLSLGLADAQSVNVRGKITNGSGSPLTNAIVEIQRLGLKDTTGADGAYSITQNLTAIKGSSPSLAGQITLSRGVLELFVGNPSLIKVEIFDVKGNLLDRVATEKTPAGAYQLDIAGMVPKENLVLIHAVVGGHSETFRYFGMQNGPSANPARANVSRMDAGLAKVAAVVDTLKVTAVGFSAKTVLLSSYDTTVNVSLDSSGGESVVQSAGCGKTRTLQNGTITIQSNGARTYILRTPDSYQNGHPYRLVVAYHESGANDTDVANNGYFTFFNMDKDSTIFVAPDGLNSGWSNTNGEDVTFTDSILAQVEGNLCIDKSRIFATGFSFGGAMSIAIACARPNVFRGVAFFSGANLSGCDGGTTPIAYYASQASQDHGSLPANSPIAGEVIQANFAAVNGCTPEPTAINYPGSGQPHTCTNYQGCSPGHPTEYCVFDGPHGWEPVDPGQSTSWDPPEAWKFIKQF